MSFIRKISARQLSVLALVIWCCALALPCLVTYSTEDYLIGLAILLMGWFSLLMGNFAWLANIFFFYCIKRLFSKKVPTNAAVITVLLSLDTFRITRYLANGVGSYATIYGYGLGVVFWFLSICLMFVAVGVQQSENNKPLQKNTRGIKKTFSGFLCLGLCLLFIMIGTTIYFAVHDRLIANPEEKQRLSHVAFKRGKVCSARITVPQPIQNISGPIKLVLGENLTMARYPFAQIKDLLSYGIQSIRVDGRDFTYDANSPSGGLVSVPSVGKAAAFLYVTERPKDGITVRLVEAETRRTVFEQTWKNVNDGSGTYCPDYDTFSRADEQPRLILTQALGLDGIQNTAQQKQENKYSEIEGVIVKRTQGMPIGRLENNIHCPDDIGWGRIPYDSKIDTDGNPFQVRDKAYYLGRSYDGIQRAVCEGEFVYIYQVYEKPYKEGQYIFNIHKRSLGDFKQMWQRRMTVSNISPAIHEIDLIIQSINSTADGAMLELIDANSGEMMQVQVPIHD
ncbi:hypothetical protein [Stenoxybacter acetivorans]|uniref:hypothetical protein n=1 Tax=Stenoxybacter acetivorans TaxID=422441 RepID=UPI00055F0750|nr:hypothetical protein [Stenoxybacter acetivorans]